MKIKWMWGTKDGGPESKVRCWGLEVKALFSVLVLKFDEGSREAFHSHAFNAVSWVLRGGLREHFTTTCVGYPRTHLPQLACIVTLRSTFHQVHGLSPRGTWVFSLRGPWAGHWYEHVNNKLLRLTHGRKVMS